MAKRFTDTDKWKKPLIRSLEAPYKLLWLYILDDCDHAGIWQVDLDVASIRVGAPITIDIMKSNFGEHLVFFDEDSKIFVPDFIEFQYGILNESNRVHQSVIALLSKYGLGAYKPLTSPLQGAKDKDKDKDKDKNKEKDKDNRASKFQKPELKEVHEFMATCNMAAGNIWPTEKVASASKGFWNYYEANGWRVGKNPMKDWKAASRNWMNNENKFNTPTNGKSTNGQLAKGAKADPAEVFEQFRTKYQSNHTEFVQTTQGRQDDDYIQDACIVD
jgi:hypothetical protein